MSVEIGQLVVNARVVPDDKGSSGHNATDIALAKNRQQELVQSCVMEVLKIIDDKLER